MSAKRIAKIFLSIFIVWQIFCAFVLPNPESLLYQRLYSSVVWYGNLFGLNTVWQFFSPDPRIRLFEYDVFSRDRFGLLHLTARGRFPKKMRQEPNRDVYNRKLMSGMYLVMWQKAPHTIGRYLCMKYPTADIIAVYLRGRVFPNIEAADILRTQKAWAMGKVIRQFVMDIHCDDIRDIGTRNKDDVRSVSALNQLDVVNADG